MSAAIFLNLDQSKILSSGNGLMHQLLPVNTHSPKMYPNASPQRVVKPRDRMIKVFVSEVRLLARHVHV